MSNDSKDRKISLTEEQASRAAETLINSWLRSDYNISSTKKSVNKDKNTK